MEKSETALWFKDDREKFEFFTLSALFGIVFFNFFRWANLSCDIPGRPDFNLFILGWSACPALGLLAGYFLNRWWKKNLPENHILFPFLICVDSVFVLLLIQPLLGMDLILGNGWVLLAVFFLIQGFGIKAAEFLHQKRTKDSWETDDPFHLYLSSFLFFIVWIFSIHGFTRMLREWKIPNVLFLAAVVGFFYWLLPLIWKKAEGRSSGGTAKSLFLYGLVFLLTAYLVVDPNFRFQRYHQGFFLGPLADLIAGKALLVNINAQYGVLIFYFLRLFFYFLPLGYVSLSFVVTLLILAQFCLFYFIARRFFRSELYAFLCLLALLALNHFATVAWAAMAPSTGPLRFGFIYILMALVLLRNQYPAWKNSFLFLESAVVATAFFWSFEVCVYTVPSYAAFLFYESVDFSKGFSMDWKGFGKKITLVAGCLLLIGGFLYLDVYSRVHEWPHWSRYLDLVFYYKGGFGSFDRPGLGSWSLIVGTLYFSLFTVLGMALNRKKENPLPENFNVLVLVTFYGILQYLYFIYRSHPNNLFHISMPSLLLFAYWLKTLMADDPSAIPKVVKKFTVGLSVFFIGIFLQPLYPQIAEKLKEQAMPFSEVFHRVSQAAKDLPREDKAAKEAESLMRRYSGDKKFLVYFLGSLDTGVADGFVDYGLDLSLYGGRFKLYPYNDFWQAGFCPPVVNRLMAFDPGLKEGDYLYYKPAVKTTPDTPGGDPFYPFENDLFKNLSRQYPLKLVEKKYGIAVYQVKAGR